ncbi:MAG: hypothetical protein Q7R62_02110 [bacterium]|nr:hypothetical protein [bacterium]
MEVTGKYSELTRGQTEAIVNKLGGMEGVKRFLAGELDVVVKAAIAFIFTLWRMLTVGVYQSVTDIRSALATAGMRLGDWAADILGKVTLPVTAETVEFGRTTVRELGFTKATKLRDILAAIKARGHKLCLATDGVAIRIGYPDQPNGECVWLAMEPVAGSGGLSRILRVGRDGGGLWLGAYCYGLDGVWNPGSEFFFRK